MKYSVIIPAYNAEKFIQTTLQSVYHQTFKDFEIIVVNDGSSDSTADILSRQSDKRLRVIHQNNSGVSVARNRAIAEAKGEYLAFLDADDVWSKDHLALAHLFFSRHPDFVWYCSAFASASEITEDMIKTVPNRANVPFEARNWVLEIAETYACANVVVLRSVIHEKKLFPEGVKMCEDTIAFMKIAIRHPMIGYLNSRTMWYRKHAGSTCHNYWRSREQQNMESLYLSHFQKIAQLPQCTEYVRLYAIRASLFSWWKRIRSMSMLPWIEEMKERQIIHGIILTWWLICCAYVSDILCKAAGKPFRIRYNYIDKIIKHKAASQRKQLSKLP
ncbi:MAG: glycosyltransferase [Akkermansia sp.]|nr:glycosyltransferase [Akkermansia sp.]